MRRTKPHSSTDFSVLRKNGGRKFGMGAKPQVVWGTRVPQRGPGTEPWYGVWGRSQPEAEEFEKYSYKQILRIFLVVFHTFSPTYAYVFSVLADIIPLSLQNREGGGAFDTVCPPPCLQVGGQLPRCPPPGPAAYDTAPFKKGYHY